MVAFLSCAVVWRVATVGSGYHERRSCCYELERGGNVGLGGGVSLTATSLVAQVDPSGWSHAMVFLFHHKMEIDEAAIVVE